MMRTIEILLVIVIIAGAFVIASIFAVLPTPRQVSPIDLRRLALTTLQAIDVKHDLSNAVFRNPDDPAWSNIQIALSACLPPDIVYNLSVYEVLASEAQLYNLTNSLTNAQSLGVATSAASYLVASSNVTFNFTPEKIGEHGNGGTLYILNCTDSNGWWITGYTVQKLAEDLYNLLSPYFQTTVMVQTTSQLADILNGTKISASPYENVTNAVVINTCGEAVPIPSGYYASIGSQDNYAKYCYILGQKVRAYNWTWASIVGYPLFYVSNTALFPNSQNTWGIYGMRAVEAGGLNAFLEGLDNQPYVYSDRWITSRIADPVYLSQDVQNSCNYYGIYPSYYQTSSRALSTSILNTYNLHVGTYVFDPVQGYIPGAVYRHGTSGGLLTLGLTRTPDIRLTAVGLLADYEPRLYRSEYQLPGTSRLVILQLGQMGGA